MKKIHVKSQKKNTASSSSSRHTHEARRITLGIALVLLGVLTVLNLLVMHRPGEVVPVQSADRYQPK